MEEILTGRAFWVCFSIAVAVVLVVYAIGSRPKLGHSVAPTTVPPKRAPVKWAVVQELLPFGYRVEEVHASQERAEREARRSRYLTAYPLDWVRAENERLGHPAEFDMELARWIDPPER